MSVVQSLMLVVSLMLCLKLLGPGANVLMSLPQLTSGDSNRRKEGEAGTGERRGERGEERRGEERRGEGRSGQPGGSWQQGLPSRSCSFFSPCSRGCVAPFSPSQRRPTCATAGSRERRGVGGGGGTNDDLDSAIVSGHAAGHAARPIREGGGRGPSADGVPVALAPATRRGHDGVCIMRRARGAIGSPAASFLPWGGHRLAPAEGRHGNGRWRAAAILAPRLSFLPLQTV